METGLSAEPIRVGVLGGTFDPIHVAHLAVAAAAFDRLDLHKVLFVVANRPWQKLAAGRSITPAADRLAMVEAAVADDQRFEASAVEIRRGGKSFTVDTLDELAESMPGAEFHLIVGSDLVATLHTWERHERLREQASLAVIDRPGALDARPPRGWRYTTIEAPPIELSSSDVRGALEAGLPVDYLVPRSALEVIDERGLYRSSLGEP